MSTAMCRVCPGDKAGTKPQSYLQPATPTKCCYRRSTTVKAPRKRTFLMSVTKHSARALPAPAGVACAFPNNVAVMYNACCREKTGSGCTPLISYSDGDGNNGRNNNNHGNGDNGNHGDGRFGDGSSSSPLLYRALLGGMALTFVFTAFPSKSWAMAFRSPSGSPMLGILSSSSSAISSGNGSYASNSTLSSSAPTVDSLADMLERSSLGSSSGFGRRSSATGSSATASEAGASSLARPRSKVLHVACKGSTLVVPLPTGGDADKVSAALPRSGPFQRRRVLDAPIALSSREAALLAAPQYRVRESVRV